MAINLLPIHMWRRTLFFWFERLAITAAERRAVVLLAALVVATHLAKPWFAAKPQYDAAFYAPLMAAFDAADAKPDEEKPPARSPLPAAPPTPIRINSATASEFERLPGIGPALAARIVAYRAEHGNFTSVEDLVKVRGIGPKLLERIRPHVVL